MQHSHDTLSEMSVLGTCLRSAEAFDSCSAILVPGDFYVPVHRWIFSALSDLYGRGKYVDFVSVNSALTENGRDDESEFIAGLVANAPSDAVAVDFAESVRKRRVERDFAEVQVQIQELANTPGDINTRLESSIDLLSGLVQSTSGAEFSGARETLTESITELQKRFDSGGQVTGLSTGLDNLDELTGGLQDGDLILLAGRPSMGKSLVAMQITEFVSRTDPVLVFSLEMPKRQITDRWLSAKSSIPFSTIMSGQLKETDWSKLTSASVQLKENQFFIDDRGGVTIDQIRTRARVGARKHGCRLIVIDYLTLIHSKGENQNLRVANITRSIKEMAKELDCPVILLGQLNREVDKRSDKRPQMADLRDSGAIEQDADVILFNYLEEKYDENTELKGILELICRKQRNGDVGSLYFDFEGWCQRIRPRLESLPKNESKAANESRVRYDYETAKGRYV